MLNKPLTDPHCTMPWRASFPPQFSQLIKLKKKMTVKMPKVENPAGASTNMIMNWKIKSGMYKKEMTQGFPLLSFSLIDSTTVEFWLVQRSFIFTSEMWSPHIIWACIIFFRYFNYFLYYDLVGKRILVKNTEVYYVQLLQDFKGALFSW